jgi:hypothetical protein
VDPEDIAGISWAARHLSHRACLLAWLLDEDVLQRQDRWQAVLAALRPPGPAKPPWVALTVAQALGRKFPEEVALLVSEGPEPTVAGVP